MAEQNTNAEAHIEMSEKLAPFIGKNIKVEVYRTPSFGEEKLAAINVGILTAYSLVNEDSHWELSLIFKDAVNSMTVPLVEEYRCVFS